MNALVPARLRPADMARVASVGLRTRRMRASLSALGIAIGVAAIVAVLGLSASSQAGLLAEINRHLGDLKREGLLAKLETKWFGPNQ